MLAINSESVSPLFTTEKIGHKRLRASDLLKEFDYINRLIKSSVSRKRSSSLRKKECFKEKFSGIEAEFCRNRIRRDNIKLEWGFGIEGSHKF
ncbi:hypothetical protein AYI69_g1328 [Smittium culicis]|uniref:Uncharacterized protein n=1 Tax=Smittium culicis TaxID=133412 RepID=A0A1R1YQJ4_9FUNG|nr:hypothetical protein AYI69_g1328 [Smittium culicis]